jgi:hypothetical protein
MTESNSQTPYHTPFQSDFPPLNPLTIQHDENETSNGLSDLHINRVSQSPSPSQSSASSSSEGDDEEEDDGHNLEPSALLENLAPEEGYWNEQDFQDEFENQSLKDKKRLMRFQREIFGGGRVMELGMDGQLGWFDIGLEIMALW